MNRLRIRPMLQDPTHSLSLQSDYAKTLKNVIRRFRTYVLLGKEEERESKIEGFARDTSYDPQVLIKGLKNKISQRSESQIRMAIAYQMHHGANLARRQLHLTTRPRFKGEFINVGTARELANVNLDLVTGIQQRYLDRIKLLVAKVLGAGKLSWAQYVAGIKRFGKMSEDEAEKVARTEVVRAITAGQAEEYRRNGIDRWTWITQIDERTCSTCRPLHGKTVVVGREFAPGITKPPVHPNCRCGVEPEQ